MIDSEEQRNSYLRVLSSSLYRDEKMRSIKRENLVDWKYVQQFHIYIYIYIEFLKRINSKDENTKVDAYLNCL